MHMFMYIMAKHCPRPFPFLSPPPVLCVVHISVMQCMQNSEKDHFSLDTNCFETVVLEIF